MATINENQLEWEADPALKHPVFCTGCRIGSGVTVMGSVKVGSHSLIGSGSLILKNTLEGVVACGHPACVQYKNHLLIINNMRIYEKVIGSLETS